MRRETFPPILSRRAASQRITDYRIGQLPQCLLSVRHDQAVTATRNVAVQPLLDKLSVLGLDARRCFLKILSLHGGRMNLDTDVKCALGLAAIDLAFFHSVL